MKLREINLTESLLKDREQVEAWLKSRHVENYTIHPDLTVDVNGNVYIDMANIPVLPVKFGKVTASFILTASKLTTLEGCPREVGFPGGGQFNVANNALTSFDGLPEKINGRFHIFDNNIRSLVGISKTLKELNGVFYPEFSKIEEGGLELIAIKGLKLATKADNYPPFSIIKKHQGGDIFECQAELIENGFDEFAKM